MRYYKKYRVYFTEYRPGYHKNIFRQDMGIGASEGSDVPQRTSPNGGDEYDVPQCAENQGQRHLNGSCTHLLTGTWMPVTQSGSLQRAYAPGYTGCPTTAGASQPAVSAAPAASNKFALHWGDWCFSGSSGHGNSVAGNASDAGVCEARCAAAAGCVAFAFQGLNAHSAPDQFRCYLFDAAVRSAPANPAEGWGNHTVCGTKKRQCQDPTSAGQGKQTTAPVLRWLPTPNASACSKACCANAACSGYTFTAAQPDASGLPACPVGKPCCWLKHGPGKLEPGQSSETSGLFVAAPPPPPACKVYLAAMHGHCHAPTCLRLDIFNNDTNEIICSVVPVYGGTNGYVADKGQRFDEPGYIANPPCMFEVNSTHGLPPPLLMNGRTIRVEHVTNSTYGHHGEMALPQAMLAYDIYG